MAESLFPFFGDTQTDLTDGESLPLYTEVAWDFVNNIPIVEKGDFKIVTGNDAVRTWVYKAMKTERFRYQIYSWDFGSELESLIGQSYTPNLTKAESARYIKEALLVNPYIKSVSNIEVYFEKGTLYFTARLETI